MSNEVQINQRKLTVTLETVTPMFLAGADQNEPELRAPSFIGALRYWTRAALGGVLGDQNIEFLKQAEEAVWGSTNGTGAVQVQLLPSRFDSEYIKALPHKPDNDPASRTQFYAIPAGTKCRLLFRQMRVDEVPWNMAVAALLLLVTHGGVGRRARRGWGTMRITGGSFNESQLSSTYRQLIALPAQKYQKSELSATIWHDYQQRVVNLALSAAQALCHSLSLSLDTPTFPARYPLLEQTLICTTAKEIFDTSVSAIETYGREAHTFRAGAEFGSANPRWASPLWVRVLPVSDPEKGYVLGLTVLRSKGPRGVDNYARLEKFVEQWNE